MDIKLVEVVEDIIQKENDEFCIWVCPTDKIILEDYVDLDTETCNICGQEVQWVDCKGIIELLNSSLVYGRKAKIIGLNQHQKLVIK